MATGNETFQWDIHCPSQALTADRTLYRTFKLEGDWYIETSELMPQDAITADATDYRTVTVTNETDSATIQTVNTTVATGQTLVAGTAVAGTLTEGSARIISQGDKISLANVHTAAGQVLGVTWSCFLRRRRL